MSTCRLPPGWIAVPLGDLVVSKSDIVDGPFGSNLKTEHYTPEGPRVVRLQNIGEGRFNDERSHISQDHFMELQKHRVLPGDVLIATLGEVLPRACVAPLNLGDAIVKADCIRVRPAPGVSAGYLAAILNSPAVRSVVTSGIQGVGRPRINLSAVRKIEVPLPPKEEQLRIVAELERRFSHVDAAVATLQVVARRLVAARRSIESRALWDPAAPLVALGDLTADRGLANGHSVKTRQGGFPVLRLTCLKDGRIDLNERKEGDWTRQEAERFLVKKGDFLVARGNGSLSLVGTGGLVEDEPDEVAYPDTLIRISLDPIRVLPGYLAAVWNTDGIRAQLESVARTTAGIYKVNQADLRNVMFPVPDIRRQAALVAELDRRLSSINAVAAEVAGTLVKACALRRSLLNAAVSGRLVPQDPSDEPAEDLLERSRTRPTASAHQAKTQTEEPAA
jgi:type I restriction enzyme S subunit